MTPLLYRYPFDPSGKNPNNAVIYDSYTLKRQSRRSIAVRYGCFYSKSIQVRDASTNELLKRGVHYSLTAMNAEATMLTGQEVHGIIVITEPTVSDKVLVSYQAVGGQFSSQIDAIEQLIGTTQIDDREVYWSNIKDLPSVFEPTKHTHDVGDIYNFNEPVYRTDRIRQAMEVNMTLELDPFYLQTDLYADSLNGSADQLAAQINAHINNKDNPHNTTAQQINAYIRQQVDLLFSQLHSSIDQLLTNANTGVNNHLTAVNPHQDTAAKIGSMTAAEMDAAINTAIANNPSGADGVYEYRYGDYTTSWSEVNPYTVGVFYSITSMSSGDRGTACRVYINGNLITDAQTLVYRDPKRTQTVIWVPGNATLSIDSNASGNACRLLVYRLRPK